MTNTELRRLSALRSLIGGFAARHATTKNLWTRKPKLAKHLNDACTANQTRP